jgi:hypothetical protein
MKQTWNDEQLRAAVAESRNSSQVLRTLGLRPVGGNYDTIRRRVAELRLDTSHWTMPSRHMATAEQLSKVVSESESIASALAALGWQYSGTTVRRFHQLVAQHDIDVSHFLGRAWNRGKCHPERTVPIESYLVQGLGRRITSSMLKKRLIDEQVLPDCCCRCGGVAWQGEATPLELDHINGDRDDNRLENLRLLCPNCHALTPTYRGRNIGNYLSSSRLGCSVPPSLNGRSAGFKSRKVWVRIPPGAQLQLFGDGN